MTALVLLDLSAAFDTIDHEILADRLSTWFGLSGTTLAWIQSYLQDRSKKINLNGTQSASLPLPYGVPQGSVLGPLLFTLYTTPLSKIIDRNLVSHHLYSDDTQIYSSFSTSDSEFALRKLQICLTQVQSWMSENKLKLNADKTEFIVIGHQLQREKFNHLFPIKLLDVNTKPSNSVKNLGVIYDSSITFGKHITQICKTTFYHIRNLKRIRKHISIQTAKSIATALVGSRLDYCNSVLRGITEGDLSRLQRVQNCLARVITRAPRFTPSAPLLKSLHWLPIRARINYKLGVTVYKCLTLNKPLYLSSFLSKRDSGRNLRSDNTQRLVEPKTKSKTGSRAFSSCAPKYWNSLPYLTRNAKSLNAFKKLQKTHLFGLEFPP